ncbi:MAG TPA: YCF48-related protein [Bacteroidota bacterium]|nr:YCF48-related protein [Bacteroidota bacterium]
MKSLFEVANCALLVWLIVVSGCTLETPSGTEGIHLRGKDLIINEVFTISPDKYYAYSWIELYNPSPKTIGWAEVTRPASGFAVGSDGTILRTSDDGDQWIDSLSDPSYGNLNGISLANPETAFVVGDGGKILKVTKRSVTVLNSGTTKNLHGIAAVPDAQTRTAYAVGDNGTLLRTIDHGYNWVPAIVPTSKNLRAVFFGGFRSIFAVGDSGTVIASANSGNSWASRVVPEPFRPYTFFSVNFVGALGWITGENGTILGSVNAGSQWLSESSKVTATLRASYFPPPASGDFVPGSGWVVGDSGTILLTSDNGAHWRKQNSGTSANINSVTFVDSGHGWVFGDGGMISVTTDGGMSWRAQQSPTTSNLHGSNFLPLLVKVSHGYLITMVSFRKTFYIDPSSGVPNFDYFTKIDSGVVVYDPLLLSDTSIPAPFRAVRPPDVSPGGFAVIVSDSAKFQDHTQLGPGDSAVIKNSIGFYIDRSVSGGSLGAHPVLWSLLPSGEIQLIKVFTTIVIATKDTVSIDTKTIDVVRWGGYRPRPDLYSNNQPAGFIPEWWSLARYSDDYGDDPSRENTSYSFYMAKDPIPRWYSQLSHKSKP